MQARTPPARAQARPAAPTRSEPRAEQQVWRGTIDQLAIEEMAMDTAGAGTIVIGDVVAIGLQDFGRENVESSQLRLSCQ